MSLLFRNRWMALLWLATTLASAWFFVTDKSGAAKLLDTAQQIRAQRSLRNPPPPPPQVLEAQQDRPALPQLLPVDEDPTADPLDPQPGDVFIDAASGQRIRIVSRQPKGHPPVAEAP